MSGAGTEQPEERGLSAGPGVERPGETVGAGDAFLIARVAGGEAEALEVLWSHHGGAVYGLARQMCGPELGEQITQEVFKAFWHQPDSYDPTRGQLRSYLILSAHQRAVEILRSDGGRGNAKRGLLPGAGEDGHSDELLADLAGKDAWDALSVIIPPSRAAIVLTFFTGMTYRQVAVALQRPEASVKRSIRQGLAQLRLAPHSVATQRSPDARAL